jgi:hypothetical protein
MSVKVMSQVWEFDLPATEKLILLGFADHANDEGICRPSFARIAWKCGISKETVKRTVRRFREPGILAKIAEAGGPGCPAAWQILTAKGVRLTPFVSDLERSKTREWGSSTPRMGVTAVTSESKTGIERRKKPRAASAVENGSVRNPAAQIAASSIIPLFKNESRKLLPQQVEYARVSRLITGALCVREKAKASGRPFDFASWKADLKQWAVDNGIPYDVESIRKALDIAEQKTSRLAAVAGSRR